MPRWTGTAVVIAVSALYVLGPPPPDGEAAGLGLDKVAHVAGFATIAAAWALAVTPRRLPLGWLALGVPLLLAGTLEILQSVRPERETSVGDVAANLAGIGLGFAAAWLLRRRTRRISGIGEAAE